MPVDYVPSNLRCIFFIAVALCTYNIKAHTYAVQCSQMSFLSLLATARAPSEQMGQWPQPDLFEFSLNFLLAPR